MTMASSANTSDRVMPISLSVLVHALIGGAIFYGWWQYHQAKTAPPSLAIQATVIRSAPATAPPAAPAPPPVDTAALERQQAEREHAEAEQRLAEKQAAERAAADRAAAEMAAQAAHQAEVARKEQEAQREAEEAAAAAAAERKAAEHKAAAERKAKQEAELKAQQDAAREQQHLTQQLQTEQRETDLRSQLQAEEHLDALQSSPAMAEYQTLIAAKISRVWNRPPSAHQGVQCTVHITQIPGGEITNVSVDNCNGDDALRQSVETAAYRASPLPVPSDPALFDPHLTVKFAPDD